MSLSKALKVMQVHADLARMPIVQLDTVQPWHFAQNGIHIPLFEREGNTLKTSMPAMDAGFPFLEVTV